MARPKKVIVEEPTEKKSKKKSVPKPPTKTAKVIKSDRDKITRAQAIKLFCIECMGFQKSLVKNCSDQQCPLWPYRKGYGQEHTDAILRK